MEEAPGPKPKVPLGVAIGSLIVGLIIGLPLGYLVAPAASPGVPAGTIILTETTVHPSVLAGPGGPFEFSIGGLENPTIQARTNTQVIVHFTNIDTAVNHSMSALSVAPPIPRTSWRTPRSRARRCHVPGHATARMYGKFVVAA